MAEPQSGPSDPSKEFKETVLEMKDHYMIRRYLKHLDNEDLIKLGGALGLSYPELEKKSQRDDFDGKLVKDWLIMKNDVEPTSGQPTWESLAKCLDDIGHKGIAKKIRQEKVRNEATDQAQSQSDLGYESQTVTETVESVDNSLTASPHLEKPCVPIEVTDWQTSGGRARVLNTLKKFFGHDDFLPGQEKAVMNILSGVSTLVIQRTASGKSLCYQLPAYLFAQQPSPQITLVISPLISLMEDQLRHFPPDLKLKRACLHSNLSQSERDEVMRNVRKGEVHVLLLSAEALVGGNFGHLPPVAFACIDEVHGIADWSHNFRPSYLRIGKVLREHLGVHCVLGLTATATHTTALSVASNLGIDQRNIIRGTILPGNLHISVSCDQDKDKALVELLQSSKFNGCESTLIYCARQKETTRIAELLKRKLKSNCYAYNVIESLLDDVEDGNSDNETENEQMNDVSSSMKRKKRCVSTPSKQRKIGWSVESYHAGMDGSKRKRVQDDFMKNRVNIVVATVAFGMGLNKSDVRAIIHYNMPKSFESFVQEIGRAGRDGKDAFCHVFIDKKGSDIYEPRHHIYNSTTETSTLKKLVERVFPVRSCSEAASSLQLPSVDSESQPLSQDNKIHVTIRVEDMEQIMDINQASISTLLCYLEQENKLNITSVINDTCTLSFPDGPVQLKDMENQVLTELRKNGTFTGMIKFSVSEVAKSMAWKPEAVRSELNDLRNSKQEANGSENTVSVVYSGRIFHIESSGVSSCKEHDHICELLAQKVKEQEEKEVEKLHLLHVILCKVSKNRHSDCYRSDTDTSMTSTKADIKHPPLTEIIKRHFGHEGLDTAYLKELNIDIPIVQEIRMTPEEEKMVKHNAERLIEILAKGDKKFTARTIARIFQGTSSPLFLAIDWWKSVFWRKYMEIDFNELCRLASEKL